MKIPPLKSKIMVFKGEVAIRSKTVTDNTILEHVNTFIHMGCKISYEN
jgi:hypothetical protein